MSALLLSRVRNLQYNDDDDSLPLLQRTHLLSDDDFRDIFRISRDAFAYVLAMLRARRTDELMKDAPDISDRTALFIALYRLSTHHSSNSLAELFQMPPTVVRGAYLSIVARLCALEKEFVCFPELRDRELLSPDFPRAAFAIGFGFINMNAVTKDHLIEEYTSASHGLGVHIQVTVCRDGTVCQLSTEPGSVRSSAMFRDTDLFKNSHDRASNPIFADHQVALCDRRIANTPWLVCPYEPSDHVCSEFFNRHLREVVESTARCQIARMKMRFRSLCGTAPFTENSVFLVLRACAVLHNICVAVGDNYGFVTEDYDDFLPEDDMIAMPVTCPLIRGVPTPRLNAVRLARLNEVPTANIVSAEFPVPRQHQPATPPAQPLPARKRPKKGVTAFLSLLLYVVVLLCS